MLRTCTCVSDFDLPLPTEVVSPSSHATCDLRSCKGGLGFVYVRRLQRRHYDRCWDVLEGAERRHDELGYHASRYQSALAHARTTKTCRDASQEPCAGVVRTWAHEMFSIWCF